MWFYGNLYPTYKTSEDLTFLSIGWKVCTRLSMNESEIQKIVRFCSTIYCKFLIFCEGFCIWQIGHFKKFCCDPPIYALYSAAKSHTLRDSWFKYCILSGKDKGNRSLYSTSSGRKQTYACAMPCHGPPQSYSSKKGHITGAGIKYV